MTPAYEKLDESRLVNASRGVRDVIANNPALAFVRPRVPVMQERDNASRCG